MRFTLASLVVFAVACGSNTPSAGTPDTEPTPDGPIADSPAQSDGPVDSPPDSQQGDGIAEAKATADGSGLSLPIRQVVVTYLKPQLGSVINDPAGFTIQHDQSGPGLFVTVDPATTTPSLVVGDVVSFEITQMGTVGLQRRAQAITNLTRISQGTNVSALATDVSAATDLVTAVDTYDSRLVNVTGVAFQDFAGSGQGFQRAGLSTVGITADANLQFRAPATLVDALDMVNTCSFALHDVPVGRFNAQTQLPAYVAGDVTLSSCPAPVVATAVALSATTVKLTFSRHLDPITVNANGSDFTIDNGLTASAAVVNGKEVTLTTSPQTNATTYTIAIATTVTDLQGTPVSGGATFLAFTSVAKVRINELNATITSGCDLIELRVIEGGSMAGFKVTEREGKAGNDEMSFTFPADFNVQKNDFVIIHTANAANAATCNPGGAVNETTAKDGQPAATFTRNFDTAFDFYVTDNNAGLVATDNVITLRDTSTAIIDAVFVSDNPAGANAATGTEEAAKLVGAANQWDPALAEYKDAVFRANSVGGLGATGTTPAGNSIQRLDDADTNSTADWTTTRAASTWGALGVGQTAL